MNSTLHIIFGSIINAILGLAIIFLIANNYSAINISEFYLSKDLVESILKVFFITQSINIVVSYAKKKTHLKLLSQIISMMVCLWSIVLLLFWLKPNFFISLYFNGIDEYDSIIISDMLLVLWVYALFYLLDSILVSYLFYYSKGNEKVMVDFSCNLIHLILLLIIPSENVLFLAYTFPFVMCIRTFSKYYILYGCGLKILLTLNFSGVRSIFSDFKPYVPNVLFQQLFKIILLNSFVSIELVLIASYYLVYRLYSAVQSVITVNLFNSKLALLTGEQKNKSLMEIIYVHIVFSIIIITFLILFVDQLALFAFGFNETLDIKSIILTVKYFMFIFLFEGVNYFVVRFLSINGRNTNAGYLGRVQVLLDIIMYPLHIKLWGYEGIFIANLQNSILMLITNVYIMKGIDNKK